MKKRIIFEDRLWNLEKVDSIDEMQWNHKTAFKINFNGTNYIIPCYDVNVDDITKPCIYMDGGKQIINFKEDDPLLESRIFDENITIMPDSIGDLIKGELNKNKLDVQENTSDEIDHFDIREKDNTLNRLIKTAVNMKKVNIKEQYSQRWSNRTTFNNNYRSLENTKSISFRMFETWLGNMDLKCLIIVDNKYEDCPNPLKDKIIHKINY